MRESILVWWYFAATKLIIDQIASEKGPAIFHWAFDELNSIVRISNALDFPSYYF